ERNVVAPGTSEPVELPAEPERDRRPGVATVLPHAEAEVLPLADRPELTQLARVDEHHDAGVAEPERRQARELLAERQAELVAGDDRVDDDAGPEVVLRQDGVCVLGERRGERVDARGVDRQTGRGPMAAEALEITRARGERAVQVEVPGRAAGALRPRDQ